MTVQNMPCWYRIHDETTAAEMRSSVSSAGQGLSGSLAGQPLVERGVLTTSHSVQAAEEHSCAALHFFLDP